MVAAEERSGEALAALLVVLAAGRSSRMGRAKGLLELDGRPWILHQLDAFAVAGGRRAIVVAAAEADGYRRAIEGALAAPVASRVLVNADPDRGPFSSLQVALVAAAAEGDAPLFVLPVDVCAPSPAVWHLLDQALRARRACAAVPVHEGRGGHPVLLSPAFARHLAALDPESERARLDLQLRLAGEGAVARVEVTDRRVLTNLNMPADWASLER